MAETSCSDSDLDRCAGLKNGKDLQRENLVAGSTALLNNAPMEGAEKFKAVLEKMGSKSNQKIPMGQLIIRYALCVAWIKCSDYMHIAEAAQNLVELIDSGYASKLPALYLALARAYFALNRFKKSLEFIEKGLKAIQSNSKIKQHSWPGLTTMIEETGKDVLREELLNLQKNCNKYDQPDALCNYDKCLEFSGHVLPSREIYFTDPDFHPFLYLRCEADCKFAYHNACWEHLKHLNHNLEEPKDLLDIPCSTDKCKSNDTICSKIIEVFLIGQNKFDKPLKCWSHIHCYQRNDKSSKSRNLSDNSTLIDKIDNASSSESSSGPTDKGESKSGGEANHSTIEHTQGKHVSSVKSMEWKNSAPPVPNFPPPRHPYTPLPLEQKFTSQPLLCSPNILAGDGASYRFSAYNSQTPSSPYSSYPPLPSCFQMVPPPPRVPMRGTYTPANIPSNGQPHQAFYQRFYPIQPHSLTDPRIPYYHPIPVRPAVPSVEVIVRSPSYLPAGTKLLVPISPAGGKVQVVANNQNSTKAKNYSKFFPVPFVIEKLNAAQAIQAEETQIKSVVNEFRSVVRKLSGEPSSTVSKSVCESLPSSASSVSMRAASTKDVVDDFKRLVHGLAGNETRTKDKSREPKQLKEEEIIFKSSSLQEQGSLHVSSILPPPCSATPPLDSSTILEDPPIHNSFPSVSSEPSSDHLMMQQFTLQARTKNSQHKDMDQSLVIASSLESSLCSSQDDVYFEPIDSSRFAPLLEILSQCRAMKFGYLDNENVNPELQCFGHPYDNYSTPVSNINIPDDIDKADENQAQFVFSYYQSVFTNDGYYKIDDLQETWLNTSNQLDLPETFTKKYSSLSEFLLKSERFAAIDDVIGTSDLLPDMFSKAEKELSESVSYLLSLQDSKPHSKEECLNNESINDLCKNNHNYAISNIPTHSRSSSSADLDDCINNSSKHASNGCDRPAFNMIRGRDWNDNPISKNSFSLNSTAESSSLPNGCLKFTSEPSVLRGSPTESEKVYLSTDDEEIDVSLTEIDPEHPPVQTRFEEFTQLPKVPSKWSDGDHFILSKTDRSVQTDTVIDSEKEKLLWEKELLRKEVSELKYEKAELHLRVGTLQTQMESTMANCESEHAKTLQQVQDKLEEKLKKKAEELKELREKIFMAELELNQIKEHVKEKEDQVSERDAQLDKLRRNHAKEINNSVKKLLEDKQHKEEEFRDTLKGKDKNYILLWKDFCEFKIKKFNHLCNDRINVLSQLRDLMSDTVQPTKSDVKCNMEKYEELMISVNKKNAEVNEIFNREMEKVNNGVQVLLPVPIEVPDIMNMHYPPEGAFEYLIKTKQEEFGVPRNLFSPALSRFYRPYASNSVQPLSQTRENEGYSSVPNSSLFGQGRNETSHVWSNSFSAPSANLSGMPFEVSNSNGHNPSVPQGFSSPNSLIIQQPALNLLPNMMSYQPSSSQNTSVHNIMGQNRSTPSPSLPFPSVNGSAFNINPSTASAVGTKPPGISTTQKPVPSVTPSIPALKSSSSVVPTSITAPACTQGAIPKPRIQTATAAMTPIVPSKGPIRPVVKTAKSNESNYEKLMRNLQKMFPTRNDVELTTALKSAREKNGNTLSSLSYSEIICKVEEILNKSRKQTSMGWEKFGQAAWGTAKPNVVEWEGTIDQECCICMNPMNAEEVYTLECKHAFHTKCIKKWLGQDSVCPICRMHSTMLDEFPPLG